MSDRLISVNELWNAVQKRRNDYGIFAHVIESEIHYLISEQPSPMIAPEKRGTNTEKTLQELKEIIEEYKSRGAFSSSQQVKYMEEGKQVALVWVLAEIDKKIEAIQTH
jgi:hypothetical protein